MLGKILPILALIVMVILGWYLYTQGTIQKILRPTVTVVETSRQLVEGQVIRKSLIEIREISVNRVSPGVVTFPAGSDIDDVMKVLGSQTVSRNVPGGQFLVSEVLGQTAKLFTLRAVTGIDQGGDISLDNVAPVESDRIRSGGVVVFDSMEQASQYLDTSFDLIAARPIERGRTIMLADVTDTSQRLFSIRASRDFSRADRLSINGLEIAEIASGDLPEGAVIFQKRGAAEVFITASSQFTLAEFLGEGDFLTVDLLSRDGSGDTQDVDVPLPRTLSELRAYMIAYPGRAMFLDDGTYLGRSVDPGDEVEVWAEVGRTDGMFGEISMTRIAEGIRVREAVDNISDAEGAEGADPEPGDESEEEGRRFLWISIDPETSKKFRAARTDGGVSFVVRAGTRVVDVLGNGASCYEDECNVDRAASSDLEDVTDAFERAAAGGETGETASEEQLVIINGVSREMAQRLRENGYDTFEKIADWSDDELPAITIKLDASENLVIYIRQQARTIASAAEDARADLGMDEAPSE